MSALLSEGKQINVIYDESLRVVVDWEEEQFNKNSGQDQYNARVLDYPLIH